MRYRDRNGARRQESTGTEDWQGAQRKLRERLQARDDNTLDLLRKGEQLTFSAWAQFFLESYSKPPMRAEKTHVANVTALKHLMPVFGKFKLAEITADQIEMYLRLRLRQRKRVKTSLGIVEHGLLKPTTVHQEFRVLRRILSVAVKKRFCAANAAVAAEFPTTLKGLFRPHYMTWSEQQRIEAAGPQYLCNVIRIITETGLRVYKELACIRKEQVDLKNRTVFIPDSKTVNGIAEVPTHGCCRRGIPQPNRVVRPWILAVSE
jgi:integrase